MLSAMTADAQAQFVNALDPDPKAVIIVLGQNGPTSKKGLFTATGYSRFRGDKAVGVLEALKLIRWEESGPAKAYCLTEDGKLAYDQLKIEPTYLCGRAPN